MIDKSERESSPKLPDEQNLNNEYDTNNNDKNDDEENGKVTKEYKRDYEMKSNYEHTEFDINDHQASYFDESNTKYLLFSKTTNSPPLSHLD